MKKDNKGRILIKLIGILLVADIALGLAVIYQQWFFSMSVNAYLLLTWDTISLWAGRIVTLSGVLIPILVYVLRDHWPEERTWKQLVATVIHFVATLRNRPHALKIPFVSLSAIAATLIIILYTVQPVRIAAASSILVLPDASQIYVITPESQQSGEIERFDGLTPTHKIGNIEIGGTPEKMLLDPKSGDIFILDNLNPRVTILDPKDNSVKSIISFTGKYSTSFAITPDGRKLYVSHQQPGPLGKISVIDLTKETHPETIIDGVNCPMGLGMLPNGSKMYVASQCGAGHDPVFIIDTKSDKVIGHIKDFAIGDQIAVARDGKRVYVSRSFPNIPDSDGKVAVKTPQISVIDTAADTAASDENISSGGTALQTSPDGKYLFFSAENAIDIVNTETQALMRLQVGDAAGIAVAHPHGENAMALYAWLPAQKRVFFMGLNGLLP
jgi:DNA-binding beta-propeller fold protein YncE